MAKYKVVEVETRTYVTEYEMTKAEYNAWLQSNQVKPVRNFPSDYTADDGVCLLRNIDYLSYEITEIESDKLIAKGC